jgi:hypothetical protein
MQTEYKLIKTIHLNKKENCIYSEYDLPVEDSTINNLTDLYKFGLKEYGKCTSKIYIDGKEGKVKHIGYVFLKKSKYEDCNEYFLMETWLTLEHYIETVEREYKEIS